ncbi:hypothetical protein Tco_0358837 [Tanacetum coccineum]
MDNRVVVVRSTHGWPSIVEWHAITRRLRSTRNCGAPALCHRVWIMLLVELRSSCSLRLCADYAPCEATGVWSLWALRSVGLGPVAYCIVWARGPDGAICH